jgi:hypothetical protein
MTALDDIEQYYPEVIEAMPKRFNSHEFILALAYRHQGAYIKVLAQYADSKSPFMSAHGQLAKMIGKFKDGVKALDYEDSTDIFGNANNAMVWTKK